MAHMVVVRGQSIRTDWIHQIERGQENGTPTCTVWLAVGPVGIYTFKGKDAEAALKLLAEHPAAPA